LKKLLSILAVCIGILSAPAQAQSACNPMVNPLTKNCTSVGCTFEACWATPDTSLTGCNLYITTPSGALPPISGTMTTPGSVCSVTAPKLISGTHAVNAAGVNAFGEGPKMATPLSLVTGGAPGTAPSVILVK
jgi:hypothetical protein